jgi:alkylhydroperoxidase family enzyme
VQAVLKDHRTAPIPPKDKALFAFLEKSTTASWTITRADVDAVVAAGWSEEAIYDAITVNALFKFYNTWVDATGVHDLPAAAYEMMGKRMAQVGYEVSEATPKT